MPAAVGGVSDRSRDWLKHSPKVKLHQALGNVTYRQTPAGDRVQGSVTQKGEDRSKGIARNRSVLATILVMPYTLLLVAMHLLF